jgi:spore maturation protein SpmA
MLNYVWLAMLLTGVAVAGVTGNVRAAVEASIRAAETAVTLSFGLIGVMSLWLGVMRLAEKSGLVGTLARGLRPIMTRLFPEVPADHPAMASMMLNIAANMLGLTNAATPFGLRAMRDLEALNPHPGTATNAMCTFLAVNTGSVQLIPASAIALLASAGSNNPTAIVGATLVATCFSSAVGLIVVKALQGWRVFKAPPPPALDPIGPSAPAQGRPERVDISVGVAATEPPPLTLWRRGVLGLVLIGFVVLIGVTAFPHWVGRSQDAAVMGRPDWVLVLDAVSLLAIPFLLSFFPLYAALRKVAVYEEFVEGAKEGFQVALRIIPYLVGMLVAIGLLRGSGSMEWLTGVLRQPLERVGFPPELVPISLIRPLSGSASLAAFSDLVKAFGPDHLLSRTAGTLFGSTETTFYVVAVYFGSVAVRRVRHAIWAGLAADAAGCVAAVVVCRMMFG